MMTGLDLTPLYRSSIGFDRMASLLDSALRSDTANGYPPYNIEVVDENAYSISIAVAGFDEKDIEIEVEKGILTVAGKRPEETRKRQYLHQGIAARSFERKFNLADHVEVTGANLKNGLLVVSLERKIPEAMKPKRIPIGSGETGNVLEQDAANEVSENAA
jgi:molecular chaperone IbpA